MFKLDPFGRQTFLSIRPPLTLRPVFMGQAPQSAEPAVTAEMIAPHVPNRLATVPVNIIRSRGQLLRVTDDYGKVQTDPATAKREYGQGLRPVERYEKGPMREEDVPLSDWSDDDYRFLAAVANDPTEDELRDLGLVDAFFSPPGPGTPVPINVAPSSKETLREALCRGKLKYRGAVIVVKGINTSVDLTAAAAANPFFCPQPARVPYPASMYMYWGGIPEFFGIDPALPWEEDKPPVLRTIAVLDALVDYPFPRPIGVMPQFWYYAVQKNFQEFVHQDIVVNRTLARLWITIAVVQTYNDASQRILHELKKEARQEKRTKIIEAVAIAVTFAIITAGLGAAFLAVLPATGLLSAGAAAQLVTSAVQYALSADQKKQAAQDMEKVAKQFEKDDPAFAAEAHKAADTLDYLAAQTQRTAELTQAEKDALKEGETVKEIGPEDVGGPKLDVSPEPKAGAADLLVGGGAAAAAGAAALLLA